MTSLAKEYLIEMANEYERTGNLNLDSMLYINCPDSVLNELQNEGYIVWKKAVADTITLTEAGYEKAKE